MQTRREKAVFAVAAVLVGVVGAGLWYRAQGQLVTRSSAPKGIMGTSCQLLVVDTRRQTTRAQQALANAEAALQNVQAKMSVFLEASQLANFNSAPANTPVSLAKETIALLHTCRKLSAETNGAFDVTCRPILQLWKQAASKQEIPSEQQLKEALAQCGWDKIQLLDSAARKSIDKASLDLGGIAKGHGIDQAVEAMIRAGVRGGLVNVGGDIRCFGQCIENRKWQVGIQSPFNRDEVFTVLSLQEGAVCTSGNYERFSTIEGKRFSHIVDPRTAQPVDLAPSVTVVAPTATLADAWATALSVLGPDGLKKIPANSGIEAMLIVGTPDNHKLHYSPGFRKLLTSQPTQP